MADVVLRAENVHKRYGELEVLKGVSFEVERGQVKVVIGPSGSGKSTLLRCLALLEIPSEGRIVMQGGEMVQVGEPAEVYRRPRNRFVAQFRSEVNEVVD